MSYLIISDLHLGNMSGSDDFTYSYFKKLKNKEKAIIESIKATKAEFLIINGDLMETDLTEESLIRRLYKNLFSYFDTFGENFERTKGNHDELKELADNVILSINGNRIFIAHGHQEGKNYNTKFYKIFFAVSAFFEKFIPVIDNLAFLSKRLYNDTLKYAEKMSTDYDAVILGHTHKFEVIHFVNENNKVKKYYNSGSCTGNSFNAILINDDGVITTIDEKLED